MFLTAQENYLTLYKSYENVLRDLGQDAKLVEANLESTDPAKSARLRMCRLFRNYLVHENDPGFLIASDKMLDFLSKEVFILKSQNDSVKQHVKPAGSYIFESHVKCADILDKVIRSKSPVIIRHGEFGYDLCHWTDVLALYRSSKAAKLSVVKSMRGKIIFAAPADRFAELDPDRITICTSDGTPDGKVIGIVKFD